MTEDDMKVSRQKWTTTNKTLGDYKNIVDGVESVLSELIATYKHKQLMSSTEGKHVMETCERLQSQITQQKQESKKTQPTLLKQEQVDLRQLLLNFKHLFNMRTKISLSNITKQIVQRILQDENSSELKETIREQEKGDEDWKIGFNAIDTFRDFWNSSYALSREEQEQIYPLLQSKLTPRILGLLKVAVMPAT